MKKQRDIPNRKGSGRSAAGRKPDRRRAPEPRRRPQSAQRRDQRAAASGPDTTPNRLPVRPAGTKEAKARAKARKAKAPKVVRPPLRDRMATRLAAIDLNPRTLAAKVPFVVLVIGSLGIGLAVTLWLSTDAAERSYQLGNAHETNHALLQQKEALERDVLEAQAAPALAEAARGLGMIPSRDTAHLVQDPAGNWVVIGQPKPAEGTPPPPLNTPLPTDTPPPPRPVDPREVTVRLPSAPPPTPATVPLATNPADTPPEVLVRPVEPPPVVAPPAVVEAPPAVVEPPVAATEPAPHAVDPNQPAPLPGPAA